jgi:mono/diheme cytochrome c family protein
MRVFLGLVVAGIVALVGAVAFVYSGVYDIAATDQHTAPVFWTLKTVMRRAVKHHARGIDVPPLADAAMIDQGRALFVTHCTRCHGAPGVAPEPFALGFRPQPANLANTGIEWLPAELFWAIKHGMKLTAMPAWEYRLTDEELWMLVAYVRRLPYESPREFREQLRALPMSPRPPKALETSSATDVGMNRLGQAPYGDPDRGRQAILQYACIACHEIPGVVGATVPVGPPLDRMGVRSFIGGVLENTPGNMVRWLRTPQHFVPDGAMPDLGVTERDARDMAAYLESLR